MNDRSSTRAGGLPSWAAASLVVTAAFIHGAILQTLIGSSLAHATPAASAAGTHVAMFTIYQQGMVWLLGSVVCSVIASFLFRPAPAK